MSNLQKRQLIALMFCDVVGYGTITTQNEALALELLEEYRSIFRGQLALYGGRENKTIGDGFFAEFSSALDAVLCAIEVQTKLYERNLGMPEHRRLQARIGIHLGDVVLSEGDSLGEGVNIAARIETFSEPGGICVSRQVADQLAPYDQIVLRRIGKKALKHIKNRMTLYHVEMPWKTKSSGPWPAWLTRNFIRNGTEATEDNERLSHRLLNGVLASVLFIFAFLMYKTWSGFCEYHLEGPTRAVASSLPHREWLGDGWEYALEPFDGVLDADGQGENLIWRPLLKPYWRYADELTHPYWLRKEFHSGISYTHPAIVLGPICGAHRTYLNGRFVGGSNFSFTLAYYSFDRTLLREGKTNYLVVKVNPKPGLTPAIVGLPQVGSFLGEFNDVYSTVTSNEFYFHVIQSIYLALAFLSFLGCFLFYLFNSRDKKYLYFSIYLLLGCMCLLHSNGIVFGFLDFRLQRAFRLFGLSLSGIVLLSTYFHLIGRSKDENVNNALAIGWSLGLFYLLIVLPDGGIGDYLWSWNFVLGCTLVYTGTWVFAMLNYRLIRLLRAGNSWRAQLAKLGHESILLFFGMVTALMALVSMKSGIVHAIPMPLEKIFFRLGTASPFLFASCILGYGFFDYALKNRTARERHRADDFLLEIAEMLKQCESQEEIIRHVQKKVSEFVQAERSSVYFFEPEGEDAGLTIHSMLGSPQATPHVVSRLQPKEGILGYVCETKAPLLIWDISTDLRFQDYLKERSSTSYRTNSCMLFPLVVGGRLVGVLTLADKKGNGAFSRRDFSLLHVVAKDFALLIQARSILTAHGS